MSAAVSENVPLFVGFLAVSAISWAKNTKSVRSVLLAFSPPKTNAEI